MTLRLHPGRRRLRWQAGLYTVRAGAPFKLVRLMGFPPSFAYKEVFFTKLRGQTSGRIGKQSYVLLRLVYSKLHEWPW